MPSPHPNFKFKIPSANEASSSPSPQDLQRRQAFWIWCLGWFCCLGPGLLDFSAAAAPREPIRLHPENPHYFLWRGQPTLLITAGEHYGAVMNLDFDGGRYLDELKAHRFN